MKDRIEQAWKKVFETDVYHADRFAEIDYEGLTSYLFGDGYDKVYDLAVCTGDIGRRKESLLATSRYHAKATHEAGIRIVEKIVELAIEITKAFYIAKLSPGMLALAAENRGQHEDITDRLDLIKGLLQELKQNRPISEDYVIVGEDVTVPNNYIGRRIYRSNEMQTNGVSAWEALCQDNHIVLTGDAGAGKSVMMRHISVDVKKHGSNPIFISLKSYPNCEPLNALLDDKGMSK